MEVVARWDLRMPVSDIVDFVEGHRCVPSPLIPLSGVYQRVIHDQVIVEVDHGIGGIED